MLPLMKLLTLQNLKDIIDRNVTPYRHQPELSPLYSLKEPQDYQLTNEELSQLHVSTEGDECRLFIYLMT